MVLVWDLGVRLCPPFGTKMGSYPQPWPRASPDMVPGTCARNVLGFSVRSQYDTTEVNAAFRFWSTSFSMPPFPRVPKIYDE